MFGRVRSFYPSSRSGVLLVTDGRRLVFRVADQRDVPDEPRELYGGDVVEFEMEANGCVSIRHVQSPFSGKGSHDLYTTGLRDGLGEVLRETAL